MLITVLTTLTADRPYHHVHPGYFDASALLLDDAPVSSTRERFRRAQTLLRAAATPVAPAVKSTVIFPTDFGADPTGEVDSSTAFNRSVAALLALAREDHKDTFHLYDLGGATLDLGGGVYTISKPVALPPGYSNFKIQSGTLVASSAFPAGEFMLSVGAGGAGCSAPASPGLKKGNCNRLVDVSHMTLDGGRFAYGCLLANHTMDVNVGPAMMVVGYTDAGISLAGSGAGFIQHAWLGAVAPGSSTPRPQATGTAIVLLDGQHDAMVDSVIIFSGQHGVRSGNGANRLQGVHAWNLAGSDGGTGIWLGTAWGGPSGGRVQNCYLDYAPLVVSNPGDLVVTGNLFLGSSTLVLAAASAHFDVRNVIITDNEHHTGNRGNASFVLDERLGSFRSVTDVVIEGNEVDATDAAANKTGTRATLSAPLAPGASSALLYFDAYLLFASLPIDEPSIRCFLHGPHATALSATLKYDRAVMVTLAAPVPHDMGSGSRGGGASVTCSVDQSSRACPAH